MTSGASQESKPAAGQHLILHFRDVIWVQRGGTCVSPKNEAQVSCKKEESEDGTGEMKTVCTQGTPKVLVQTLHGFVMLDLSALLWK